jgi:hypothetical protein
VRNIQKVDEMAPSAWNEAEGRFEELHRDQLRALLICGSRALAKACVDSFDYALKLNTGEVFRFTDASIMNSEWVHIAGIGDSRETWGHERGIDIRLSSIVWVMDAPEGS